MDTSKYLETFQGTKPQRFPPIINVLPKKTVNLDFADELFGKLGSLDEDVLNPSTRKSDTGKEAETQKQPVLDAKSKQTLVEQIANVKAFRQIARFHSFNKFLPNAQKAHIELIGSKGNYERLRESQYQDLRSALNAAFWNSEKEYIKNRRLRGLGPLTRKEANSGLFGYEGYMATDSRLEGYVGRGDAQVGDFYERNIYGQNPKSDFGNPLTSRLFMGEQDTYLHNLNLYNGADNWQIFKQQDEKNSKIFNENPFFSPISSQFMSPLTVLTDIDPEFIKKMQNTVKEIRESKRESFVNKNEASNDYDLNWENAPDPYTDNDIDSFDINAGYYDLGMSQLLATVSPEESFFTLAQMAEDRKRYLSVQTEILQTKIFDLPNPGGNAEEAKKRGDEIVEKVKKWYDDIGENVGSEALLIPFNLMSSMTNDIDAMIGAWGSWGESGLGESAAYISSEHSAVRDNLINGYLDHLSTKVLPKITEPRAISVEYFSKFGQAAANFIIQDLIDKSVIDKKGNIVADIDKPDYALPMTDQKLGEKVLQILKQQSMKELKLDRAMQQNVKLIDPENGQARTLEELNQLVGQGNTPLEKYKNARKVYNTYFDIFESMTGLGLKTGASNGKAVGTQVGDQFKVTVYPKADFDQYGIQNEAVVPLDSAKSKPLEMTFQSEDEANAFLRQVRVMIAALEPVVATFAPGNNNGPGHVSMTYEGGEPRLTTLRVLTDNAGSMDAIHTITEVDDEYRIQVDVLSHHDDGNPPYGQTDEYQAVKGLHRFYFKGEESFGKRIHNELGLKAMEEVFRIMNEKIATNRMLRIQHERKWEEFKEEFEKHVEEEFRREVEEIKSYLRARARHEEREKYYEKLRKETQEQLEMEAKKRKAESQNKKKK